MKYRHLGQTGLQVSELSLGSWVTFGNQAKVPAAVEIMAAAYASGVNFFDNAEVYAGGKSEEVVHAGSFSMFWLRPNKKRSKLNRIIHQHNITWGIFIWWPEIEKKPLNVMKQQ